MFYFSNDMTPCLNYQCRYCVHCCLISVCSQESQGEGGGGGGGGGAYETAEDDEFDTSARDADLPFGSIEGGGGGQDTKMHDAFDANGNQTLSRSLQQQQAGYAAAAAKQLTVAAGSSDMSDVSSDIDDFASQVRKRNAKGKQMNWNFELFGCHGIQVFKPVLKKEKVIVKPFSQSLICCTV